MNSNIICNYCNSDKDSVKSYIARDAVTDQYVGYVDLCDDCVDVYESECVEVVSLED